MIQSKLYRACALVLFGLAAAGCGDNLGGPSAPAPDAPVPDAPRPVDAPPVSNEPPRVTIADGEVRGSITGDARQFLGIPYARPPVGALRWAAPQPPERWTTTLEATAFGKRCAQLGSELLQNVRSTDEDCLYLNVWTPNPAPSTALPVMLWFHGGGNVNGSASEPLPFVNSGVFYSGRFLAEDHGVVVVSINYRLGMFGFFAHPDLDVPGNQGLLDQRRAMQWVKDNIAAFGGDPGNVTIFGESAGAQDVCLHVASPGSRGLFHRAISQSGGCTTRMTTRAETEVQARGLATDAGCDGDDALACLRGKTAAELMADPEVVQRMEGDEFGPIVDGAGGVVPDQPRALYDAGEVAKVPYVLGSNADEGTLFTAGVRISTEAEYLAALDARFGAALAAQVAAAYPISDFADGLPNPAIAALSRVVGDSSLVCSTQDTALRAAAAGSQVWMYNFEVPSPIDPPGVVLGATHGAELPLVFGTSPLFSLQSRAVSNRMMRYWTLFARTGSPNGGEDLAWPRFAADANVRIRFTEPPATVTDFRAAVCRLWSGVYDARF